MGRSIFSLMFTGILSVPLAAWSQVPATPIPSINTQLPDTFAADLAHVRSQIAEAERDLSTAPGGLLGDLTRMRISVYRLTEALLEHRAAVAATGASVPAVLTTPDPARIARAEAEVAAARQRVAAALAQTGQSGGLMGVLAQTTLATERQSLALAELAAVSARQGFALSFPPAGGGQTGQRATPDAVPSAPRTADADDRLPDVPRSRAFTPETRSALEGLGYSVQDDWAFRLSRSRMDDTAEATGRTLAIEDYDSTRNSRTLFVACVEGETRIFIDTQNYLMTDYQRQTVRVSYRIGQRPAVSVNWGTSTSGRATGLWGRESMPFIRGLLDGEELLVRVIEQNNRQHDMAFSLRGFRSAAQAVADACRWLLQVTAPQPAPALAPGQQPPAPRPAGSQRR